LLYRSHPTLDKFLATGYRQFNKQTGFKAEDGAVNVAVDVVKKS
jgi:hypothetical protein